MLRRRGIRMIVEEAKQERIDEVKGLWAKDGLGCGGRYPSLNLVRRNGKWYRRAFYKGDKKDD